jgi:uncharacterized protein (DUF2141 family)
MFFLQFPATFSQVNNFDKVERGTINIKISGFESDKGDCWFALDNSKEVYESKASVFIGKILPIINRSVNIKLDSLEYGEYAIRVFHDENGNGKLDLNFLGIPTEDYGYSNNVSAWFGPPRWEKASFILNQSEMQIEISVD